MVTRSLSSPRHRAIQRSPPDHSSTPTVTPLVADLEPILQELRERREEYQHLVDEVEGLKVRKLNLLPNALILLSVSKTQNLIQGSYGEYLELFK